MLAEAIVPPDGWEMCVMPLPSSWHEAVSQYPELPFKGLLLQNTRADEFLVELADERVAEVHVSYHGGAGITFASLQVFGSFSDWISNRDHW